VSNVAYPLAKRQSSAAQRPAPGRHHRRHHPGHHTGILQPPARGGVL